MVFNMASSAVSQMQQGKQKRPRKTNWSDSEITVLTEKVEEYLDLIRSKFSNNVTNAKKNAAWLEITEAINAVGGERGGGPTALSKKFGINGKI